MMPASRGDVIGERRGEGNTALWVGERERVRIGR
jgi:hypothetical protein